eukprot:TRINITY_DN20479_c0_g1_i1.p1 TRINITY_DN20479_c0_g1~~TRINITY_DN20479_c0_g1_i1.p1  ORF type:complete len:638 (-),score=107.22 TRINITY_DN20479_c0_g1_i1:295-2052(-)
MAESTDYTECGKNAEPGDTCKFLSGEFLMICFGILLYGGHLFEAFFSSKTMALLSNVISEADFVQYVSCLQEAEAYPSFAIHCYHTVSSGGPKNQTRRTVTTHRASYNYKQHIQGQTDETLSADQTMAMFHLMHDVSDVERGGKTGVVTHRAKTMMLMCEFVVVLLPRDAETELHANQTRDDFWAKNTRDMKQDKTVTNIVPGFTREVCIVVLRSGTDSSRDTPFWVRPHVFMLCTVLMASLPYRLLLFNRGYHVTWEVMKHYSIRAPSSWEAVPTNSRMHRADAASKAWQLNPRMEEGQLKCTGFDCEASLTPISALLSDVQGEALSEDPPPYWQNRDLSVPFDAKVKLADPQLVAQVQQVLDKTFVVKATRDRGSERLPTSLRVEQVIRIEDSLMWRRYAHRRADIARSGPCLSVGAMPGSGDFKTTSAMIAAEALGGPLRLSADLLKSHNETFLFHGTSPQGALGIGEHGFDLNRSGSGNGSMFGDGIYLAEASSKSDEYARQESSGVFAELYGLLICRTILGNLYYTKAPCAADIEQAAASGRYTGVLGDREAAVNTFREFIAWEEEQVYPEYVVIYRRVL